MSDTKVCEKCGSQGPFSPVANGVRCQQCGAVETHPVLARYEQVPDPPRRASDASRIGPKNPLGM
jgi:hypothetical protein